MARIGNPRFMFFKARIHSASKIVSNSNRQAMVNTTSYAISRAIQKRRGLFAGEHSSGGVDHAEQSGDRDRKQQAMAA